MKDFIKNNGWVAFKFAVIVSVLAGVGRAGAFFYFEQYRAAELQVFGLNILLVSLWQFLILVPVTFAATLFSWAVYRKFEGLFLAGLIVSLPALPLAYYLNTNVFPGFYTPPSMIGNGVIGLVALALTLLIFRKFTLNTAFIARISATPVFAFFLLIPIAALAAKFFQPSYVRLASLHPTPQGLIEFLDLPTHEGANGRSADARDTLYQYFAEKAAKHRETLRANLAGADSTHVAALGDSVIARKYIFSDREYIWPEDIDLRENPIGDRQWIVYFNRLKWFKEIVEAWLLTGDSKYPAFFNRFMHNWFAQENRPSWKDEPDAMWSLFTVGTRMPYMIDAWMAFFETPEMDEEIRWKMLASVHEQANFLCHFRSPRKNHLLHENIGVLAAAAFFPEFKMAETWRDVGTERLEFTMNVDVYPDGGYKEASVYYHRLCMILLKQLTDLAELSELDLSEHYYQQLEEMYHFLMYTVRPNGEMPQTNDGFFTIDIRNLFDYPAEKFNRPDFYWFNTSGDSGAPPKITSTEFPYTGLYTMRSDWSDSARFMLADAGLFGSAHGHEDKLHFELYAFGKPFIVESGTFTYNYTNFHRYFEKSFGHNTIVIDGRSQIRSNKPSEWLSDPSRKLPNVWESNEVFDYLESTYDEDYGNIKEDVVDNFSHTRRFLFVKPDYWVVWDVVESKDAGDHSIEQRFHFPPGPEVTLQPSNDVIVSYENGPAFLMKTFADGEIEAEKIVGQENPIQGWFSDQYGHKEPSPTVTFETTGALPKSFVNILLPLETNEMTDSVRVSFLPVEVNGNELDRSEGIGLKIESVYGTDVIMLAPGIEGEKVFGENRSKNDLAVIRN